MNYLRHLSGRLHTMNSRDIRLSATLSLFSIATMLSLPGVQAQEAVSSASSSVSLPHSRMTTSTVASGRASLGGGGSSWVAGRSNFGSVRQANGVWKPTGGSGGMPNANVGSLTANSSTSRTFSTSSVLASQAHPSSPINRQNQSNQSSPLMAHSPAVAQFGSASSHRSSAQSTGSGHLQSGIAQRSQSQRTFGRAHSRSTAGATSTTSITTSRFQ